VEAFPGDADGLLVAVAVAIDDSLHRQHFHFKLKREWEYSYYKKYPYMEGLIS
jgi:hypothetical protein